MDIKQLNTFNRLRNYCEKERFKGWDPYDGLNSQIIQLFPIRKIPAFLRLLFIQGFKRIPFHIRPLCFVPKTYNTKGLSLFLQGYCNLYRCIEHNPGLQEYTGSKIQLTNMIGEIADLLISLQSKNYSGACWGYSFDWQSKAFFLPANTPTVVVTSFAVEALLSAYEITKNDRYKETALSAGEFIIHDLNRIEKPEGFMFSYSPLDHRAVYNATLLGTKTLALLYAYNQKENYKKLAYESALAVCNRQNPDGSFPHSDQVGNGWRDNFHTGFKLESLATYQQYCKDNSFTEQIEKGYRYWIQNYFDPESGFAWYYDDHSNKLVDLHCAAQAFPTLFKLGKLEEQEKLANKILDWAIANMFDTGKGYFYFQKNNKYTNKTPYMRWPNAWMFYGMSYWFLYQAKK